jgi:hypothetical protein
MINGNSNLPNLEKCAKNLIKIVHNVSDQMCV